jgi:hypothetical protein
MRSIRHSGLLAAIRCGGNEGPVRADADTSNFLRVQNAAVTALGNMDSNQPFAATFANSCFQYPQNTLLHEPSRSSLQKNQIVAPQPHLVFVKNN